MKTVIRLLVIIVIVLAFNLLVWVWELERRVNLLEHRVHSLELSRSIQGDTIDSIVTQLQKARP